MGNVPWTSEQETILRERFSQISASRLATEILEKTGREVSRSAVIARARRMGILKTREERSMACSVAQLERRGRLGRISSHVAANAIRTKATPNKQKLRRQEERFERATSADHLGIAFFDLKPIHCRFPHGDGMTATFCGQSVQDGSSYCGFHHTLCYTPLQRRTAPSSAKWGW
jgi:GcrA cell cycle regulator